MMGQLERRAEAIPGEFNSQNIANTLWAYATIGSEPAERMARQLERPGEARYQGSSAAGSCKHAVGVCETGNKAGGLNEGQLERRAEAISGEFNAQSVANTLWAFATMGTKPGDRVMGSWSGGRRQYQGISTRRLLQTLCGC